MSGTGNHSWGASVFLTLPDSVAAIGATTDSAGHYRLEGVPVGRQQLTVSYIGYETAVFTELLIGTGKEFIQNIKLKERPEALGEVVVRAKGENHVPHPLGVHSLKVEEQFRYPTTYYDPARLATSLPGVVGADDQGNSISVRGNSPASVKWRLEGVEIVNPNHTANAGTFSDRPTAAGGGVNILSAQLLGTSNFLTGTFPAGYGNALGGIMDMYFRKGNEERHEFTAQASVIGLEAAAEGPLGSRQSTVHSRQSTVHSRQSAVGSPQSAVHSRQSTVHSRQSASYLVNYRYSFVGLLTAAGVDFGGEEITFQDLSFHLSFPILKNAKLGFFGMGGLSENIFKSPLEIEKVEEEKDLFDIDFHSKMGALGLTFQSPLSKRLRMKIVAAHSGLKHERTADLVAGVPQPARWDDDQINENKTAFWAKFFYKKNARTAWEIGLQATREQSGFYTFFTNNFGSNSSKGEISGWLLQPFISCHAYLTPKLKLTAGLHGSHFTYTPKSSMLMPRASLVFYPKNNQQFSLAFGWYGQLQQPQAYLAHVLPDEVIDPSKSRQVAANYQQRFGNDFFLKTEIYYQHLYDVPVSAREGSAYSVLNSIEPFGFLQDTLSPTGKGRNYGIDILLERPIIKNRFGRIGVSLYRSQYTAFDGVERPTRFDGRYLIHTTLGREKNKKKKNKTVIIGYSSRITWHGGFRHTPISVAASSIYGHTVFEESKANELKLKDYMRMDWRLYFKWNKPHRTSTFSIDIQNITNRKNEAYLYFDRALQRVLTKKQLGLIPLLSYRVEF